MGQSCTPNLFTLQAFSLEQITSNNFSTPRQTKDSFSGAFTLLAHSLVIEQSSYFRILIASNRSGEYCDPDSSLYFYDFSYALENGK